MALTSRQIYITLLLLLSFSTLQGQDQIYKLTFKVKTTITSDSFPVIAATKEWNSSSAFIIDLTSNSNFGKTLTSGIRNGWSIFLQPNGAWGWNLGDNKRRLDYLPTTKQKINDGKWHEITQVYDFKQEAVRLFFDNKEVAIYNWGRLEFDPTQIIENIQLSDEENLIAKGLKVEDAWVQKAIKIKNPSDTLKIVNWNIWHGGRHNGIPEGVEQTIQILEDQQADIITLQETYGSGPIIADALGMYFYLISSNLSILSKFPIVGVFSPWDDFRFGGAFIKTGPEQYISVLDVWLNYLPDTHKRIQQGAGYGEILEEEIRVRGREALDMMKAYEGLGIELPTVVGGDFNSGSHLDWTIENSAIFNGYFLPWPVSRTMAREGFIDSFRSIYRNPKQNQGFTWSPRFKDVLQYRIDYIYHDQQWQTLEAGILGYEDEAWPSDHALTWAQVALRGVVKP